MRYLSFILLIVLGAALSNCEKEIDLELPPPGNTWVVEGYVQSNEFPYVILTRNTSFFGGDAFTSIGNLYVHDANVTVSQQGMDYNLQELCLSNLPPNLKPLVSQFLGVNVDSLPPELDVCVYVNFQLTGQEGEQYDLRIQKDDTVVTASTFIPTSVPIDSMWIVPETEVADSLVRLWVQFDEPDTLGNFYRYFTKRNSEPFYPGLFGSVLDDEFFNGQLFRFNLDRGYDRNTDIDFETYGLFLRGDTIIVNISSIDRAHFRFWETAEDQLRSGGPFASPTYITSNVEGGLGIWGGYGAAFDTLVVPK